MPAKTKIELSGVRENVRLASYTTFQIGGLAKYFYIAKIEKDIIDAIKWAKQEKLKYFVFGGGSNLLIADEGFDGLVIKNENIDFKIDGTLVTAGSGLNLGFLVAKCLESKLTGLEFLVGIPGTVGGAVRGNAGAWGHAIGELVELVNIYTGEKTDKLTGKECKFSYRGSVLKEKKQTVLGVVFRLNRGDVVEAEKQMRDWQWQRSTKQPLDQPSAGSVFKNVFLTQANSEKIKRELELRENELSELIKGGKISAAYLISRLDLAGKTIGAAEISRKQANFIVNKGGATASDVIQLISFIKQQVRDRLGIQLEEEVQYLGF